MSNIGTVRRYAGCVKTCEKCPTAAPTRALTTDPAAAVRVPDGALICANDLDECASNPCKQGAECVESSTNADVVYVLPWDRALILSFRSFGGFNL